MSYHLPSILLHPQPTFLLGSSLYGLVAIRCLLQRSESFLLPLPLSTPTPTTRIVSTWDVVPTGITHHKYRCGVGRSTTGLSSHHHHQQNILFEKEGEKQLLTTKKKRRTWEESFQLLVSYKEKHGNCNVPRRYTDDRRLGMWVNTQRTSEDRLSDERIVKLNDLGFSWSKKQRTWEESFQLLVSYKEKHGNCNVPQKYKDDSSLGNWVSRQRKQKDRLSDERIAKLDGLGFSWSKKQRTWEESFQLLVSYKEKHGNCNVPQRYTDDLRLGFWVTKQRDRKDRLDDERIGKLDGLGFSWSNEINEEQWNKMFRMLELYTDLNDGDCNIPHHYVGDNVWYRSVCMWIPQQRLRKSRLSKERFAKLDNLGLIWEDTEKEKNDRKWNEMKERLKHYKLKYGDCRVPSTWKEDRSLGIWVSKQRALYRQEILHEDRKIKLEKMDFTWKIRDAAGLPSFSGFDFRWSVKFGILLNFLEEHGHCNVPHNYKKDISLAGWVHTQRKKQKKGTLHEDRKERLDDIGLTWSSNDQKDEHWREKYEGLKLFKETNGHLRLPTSSVLSRWATKQRVLFAAGNMTFERKSLLDEIDFRWKQKKSST